MLQGEPIHIHSQLNVTCPVLLSCILDQPPAISIVCTIGWVSNWNAFPGLLLLEAGNLWST